jgi:lactaldehyde dehydrogenase / glycolaldehyde dehydrogenase
MNIVQREVFDPVLPILPFDDFDEVVNLANDSRYDLTAYVFTSDLHVAMRAIADIDFGEIYVNKRGPEQLQGFHTGYRLSAMGDDGPYGYERYLRRKRCTYITMASAHLQSSIPSRSDGPER